MKASELIVSELRIGNYMSLYGILVEMTSLDFNFEESHIKPIPLTEEWLLKFGFDETEKRTYEISNFKDSVDFCITLEYNSVSLTLWGDDPIYFKYKTMYVHQLQNLYFALTNEELTYEQQK